MKITPRDARHSRAAVPISTSSTAARSKVVRLIALRTLAVAVCRSNASCVSLNMRTFWIAITAWSAKVCSSSSWWALNCPGSLRVTLMVPVATPSCSIGTIRMPLKPRRRATSRKAAADSGNASVSPTETGFAVRAALECETGIGNACFSASLPAWSVLDSATRCS